MTVSRRQALAAGVAALPVTALAAAQPPAAGTQPQAGARAGAQMSEDPFLAACMLLGGKRQIEVCRFAQPKITDAEVKAFSQAEINEHETLKADLAKLGYQPPAIGGVAGGVRQAGATDQAQGRTDGTSVTVGRTTFGPELSRATLIDAEVHDTCIANVKQMLTKCEQKGKAHFDKGFVGDQLHAHMGLKDKVTTFMKHASQEMQPSLQKALGIIEQHLATCEKLMEKCEKQAMAEMQGQGRRNDQ